MCYSESASKTTSKNIYFIKKYFSSKIDPISPQLFFYWILPCGPNWSLFDEKYFLIKYMFFDVVFDADSE
jgi:hypothetical protein